jgi:hypothetical protein
MNKTIAKTRTMMTCGNCGERITICSMCSRDFKDGDKIECSDRYDINDHRIHHCKDCMED